MATKIAPTENHLGGQRANQHYYITLAGASTATALSTERAPLCGDMQEGTGCVIRPLLGTTADSPAMVIWSMPGVTAPWTRGQILVNFRRVSYQRGWGRPVSMAI